MGVMKVLYSTPKVVHVCSSHMLTNCIQSKSEFGVKYFAGSVTYDVNSDLSFLKFTTLFIPIGCS